MKYKLDTSRMGMLIFLGVALAALWLVAAYGFYKESERVKYDVRVSPGAVTYGTHSTALMPVTISPIKHALPMISGAAVRSYAHGGHATMSSGSSAGSVHTTSSAKVKSIGSGAGSGSVYTSVGSSNRSSSRGIQYGGGSVTMPSIAMVSTASVTHAEKATRAIGMRKAKWSEPTDPGTDGEWYYGGEGDWWFFDEEGGGWRAPIAGVDTRYDAINDRTLIYTGTDWVDIREYNPEGVPVGPMPWLFMLLLATGYVGVKRKKGWSKTL